MCFFGIPAKGPNACRINMGEVVFTYCTPEYQFETPEAYIAFATETLADCDGPIRSERLLVEWEKTGGTPNGFGAELVRSVRVVSKVVLEKD